MDRIFRYENIKDKYGEILQETIDINLTPQHKMSRQALGCYALTEPN